MPPTTPNNNKSLTQAVKDGTNAVAARAIVAAEAKGDTPSKVSQRQLNFSKAEDIALTKAYINASDDPVVGNNQKGMDFWKKVHANFVSLMEKEDGPPPAVRGWNACRDRFQKRIQKDVQEFHALSKSVHAQHKTGWTPEMFEQAALEAWINKGSTRSKPFQFLECSYLLRALPKFDPMVETAEDDEVTSNANVTGKIQGQGLKRPGGTKKAKKQLKEGETGQFTDIDSNTTPPKNVFANVAEENRKRTKIYHQMMANRMQQEAAKFRNEVQKQQHDMWNIQANLALQLGDVEEAKRLFQLMKGSVVALPVENFETGQIDLENVDSPMTGNSPNTDNNEDEEETNETGQDHILF
jgi:hypothetical protein